MFSPRKTCALILLLMSALCSGAFADKPAKPLILPAVLAIPGVGVSYGLGVGYQNLGSQDISIIGGAAFGDSEVAGALIQWPISPALSSGLGVVGFNDVELQTNYLRGINDEKDYLVQKLSGSAVILFGTYQHSRQLSSSFNLTITQAEYQGFENSKGVLIVKEGKVKPLFRLAPAYTLGYDTRQPQSADLFKGYKAAIGLRVESTGGLSTLGIVDTSYALSFALLQNRLTLLLGVARSDSFVISSSQYNTIEKIREAYNQPFCEAGAQEDECLALEAQISQFILDTNSKGMASPLGGVAALRGYRQFRFKAGHTARESLELGWLLTRGSDPWSMVTFADLGHAADDSDKLYDNSKLGYGAELRKSVGGLVARLGYAQGEERGYAYIAAGNTW